MDIKDRRQNIFPKEHKHMTLDSVFDSSREDNLCFLPFIRVKMDQHCRERSKVPPRCLVHLIEFWSGGKDYTKDGLCVLCAYLSETYTTNTCHIKVVFLISLRKYAKIFFVSYYFEKYTFLYPKMTCDLPMWPLNRRWQMLSSLR